MKARKFILICSLMFSLVGCSTNNSNSATNDGDVEFTKLSSNHFMDQTKANQAKQFLAKNDEITAIKAVNTDKDLIVSIEVHHHDRIKLAKLRKKFSKELEKKFPKYKTELSTDKKIFIELDRLEKKINSHDISNKKLKKEVKHLLKLSKEKT